MLSDTTHSLRPFYASSRSCKVNSLYPSQCVILLTNSSGQGAHQINAGNPDWFPNPVIPSTSSTTGSTSNTQTVPTDFPKLSDLTKTSSRSSATSTTLSRTSSTSTSISTVSSIRTSTTRSLSSVLYTNSSITTSSSSSGQSLSISQSSLLSNSQFISFTSVATESLSSSATSTLQGNNQSTIFSSSSTSSSSRPVVGTGLPTQSPYKPSGYEASGYFPSGGFPISRPPHPSGTGGSFPIGATVTSANFSITSSTGFDFSWARNPACTASWQSRVSAGHGHVVTTQAYVHYVTVGPGETSTRTYHTGPFMSQVTIIKTYVGPTTGTFTPQVLTNGVDTPCCGDCYIRYPNVRVYYWPVKKNANTWCLKYNFTSVDETGGGGGFGTIEPGGSSSLGGFLTATSGAESIPTGLPKLSERGESLIETNPKPTGSPTLKRRRHGRFLGVEKPLFEDTQAHTSPTTSKPASSTITPFAELPPWSPHVLSPRTFQPINGSENGTIVYAQGPNGMIFTSPSVYVVISTIDARDKCGNVGNLYTSMTLSFAEDELSTVDGYIGGTRAFDFADLPCPPVNYVSDIHVPNPIIGNPALQSALAKNYKPRILVPTKSLESLDPKWASCAIVDIGNGYDPPRPLVPVTGLDPISTPEPAAGGDKPGPRPRPVPITPHAEHSKTHVRPINVPEAHSTMPWAAQPPAPTPHDPQPQDPSGGKPNDPQGPILPPGAQPHLLPGPEPEQPPTVIAVPPDPPLSDPPPSPAQPAPPMPTPVVVGGMTFTPAPPQPAPADPAPVKQPQPFTQGGFTFTPVPAAAPTPQSPGPAPLAPAPVPEQPGPGAEQNVPAPAPTPVPAPVQVGDPGNPPHAPAPAPVHAGDPGMPVQAPAPGQQAPASPANPIAPWQQPQAVPAIPQAITAGGFTMTPVPALPGPAPQAPGEKPAPGQPSEPEPAQGHPGVPAVPPGNHGNGPPAAGQAPAIGPKPIVVGGITAVPENPFSPVQPGSAAAPQLAPPVVDGISGGTANPVNAPAPNAVAPIPVATVGGKPVVVGPSNAFVGGQVITVGAPAHVIAGTPISLGDSAIVIGSQTIVKPPVPIAAVPMTPIAPLVVGGSTFVPNPTGFAIGGTPVVQGGPSVVIANTPISLGSQGLVIGTKTIPPQQLGGVSAKTVPTAFSIAGTTISKGGPGIVVSGTPVSLGDSGLVVGSTTVPLAAEGTQQKSGVEPSVFSIDGTALTRGGPAVTISNTRLSLGDSGLVVGSKTVPLPPIITPPPSLPGGQGAPAVLSVAGTALTEGAAPITIRGTRLSLGAAGLVIGSSTVPLPAGASSVFAAGGQQFTAAPEVFSINGQGLTYGAPAITVSGTRLSLGDSGLVIGSSTIPMPISPPTGSASIFAVAGHTFTAAPSGFAIAPGTTLYPGGPAATISGTRISAAASSIVIGSYTYALPPPAPSVFTIGKSTITASEDGFSIGSTILTPGGPATIISGTRISLNNDGKLIIGSKTYDLPPQSIFTTDGVTLTANAAGYMVSGTEISSGGPAITIHGTRLSIDGTNLIIGTDTIPLEDISPKTHVHASKTADMAETITGSLPTGSAGAGPTAPVAAATSSKSGAGRLMALDGFLLMILAGLGLSLTLFR